MVNSLLQRLTSRYPRRDAIEAEKAIIDEEAARRAALLDREAKLVAAKAARAREMAQIITDMEQERRGRNG